MKNKNSVYLDKVSKLNKAFNISNEETLLLEAPKENLQILETINLTNHIHKVNNKFNTLNRVKQLSSLYNRNAFLGSNIKKLCVKYDLKLCKAEHFLVEIDNEIATIINKFVDEHAIYTEEESDIDEYYYNKEGEKCVRKALIKVKTNRSNVMVTSRNFFILAPSENFIDENSSLKNATLFYRDHDDTKLASESDCFIELYSWGENYSETRMLNYLFNLNKYEFRNDDISIRNLNFITISLLLLLTLIFSLTNSFNIATILINIIIILPLVISLFDSKLNHFQTWNQNNFSTR